MVYGDRHKYLSAILTLDIEEAAQYASAHGISYHRPEELATHPQICQLLESRVAQLNQHLASYETIKKFIIAPTDFSPETGELTPTLKIKRKVVTQKYQAQLEQLYAEE
jgi:long-chain acyl-CoA synthetase